MFFQKKNRQSQEEAAPAYDQGNWRPVIKCSICNGEQVAGFKNIHTGEFREEAFLRTPEDLRLFLRKYGLKDVPREY